MDRDVELLIHRATPLIFGIFGYAEDDQGAKTARGGGSGIFIAPFQALTARHVCRDLFWTIPDRFDDLYKKSKGYFWLPHSAGLFQIVDGRDVALWGVTRTWDPRVTDISLIEVSADSGAAIDRQHEMPTRFFEWSLLPPPVGSPVLMLGFPGSAVTFLPEEKMNVNCSFVLQSGTVKEVFARKRDDGMYSFPCFSVDQPVDHGFSGGPVFWGDRLCGIVSGGSIEDVTYVASLWPLCLMEYEYPDLGAIGQPQAFAGLFEKGVLKATGWRDVVKRVSRQQDEHGQPYAQLDLKL